MVSRQSQWLLGDERLTSLQMDAFNVTALEELGYFALDQDLANPVDPRWAAQEYSEALDTPEAQTSAVLSFAALGAYTQVSQIEAAQSSYYATAGYNGEPSSTGAATTVVASSSGYAFPTSTYSGPATAASNAAFGESSFGGPEPSWSTSWTQPTQSWPGPGFINHGAAWEVTPSTSSPWGPPTGAPSEAPSSGGWGGFGGSWMHWRA